MSGELASGVHFNEVEFAERCGVSRSPIREAIRMLEHEGLLHTEASGRTKVSAWTSTDLHDLYDLRYDLEWKAAQTWLQQSWPVERSVDLLQVIADMEASTTASASGRCRSPLSSNAGGRNRQSDVVPAMEYDDTGGHDVAGDL